MHHLVIAIPDSPLLSLTKSHLLLIKDSTLFRLFPAWLLPALSFSSSKISGCLLFTQLPILHHLCHLAFLHQACMAEGSPRTVQSSGCLPFYSLGFLVQCFWAQKKPLSCNMQPPQPSEATATPESPSTMAWKPQLLQRGPAIFTNLHSKAPATQCSTAPVDFAIFLFLLLMRCGPLQDSCWLHESFFPRSSEETIMCYLKKEVDSKDHWVWSAGGQKDRDGGGMWPGWEELKHTCTYKSEWVARYPNFGHVPARSVQWL